MKNAILQWHYWIARWPSPGTLATRRTSTSLGQAEVWQSWRAQARITPARRAGTVFYFLLLFTRPPIMNSFISARYMLRAAFLATLVALATAQPTVAAGEPFSGQLQQGYGEMMDPDATQGMACKLQEVAGEWSIHFVGVDLAAHPDACGR